MVINMKARTPATRPGSVDAKPSEPTAGVEIDFDSFVRAALATGKPAKARRKTVKRKRERGVE
jgi:hypothetical protein